MEILYVSCPNCQKKFYISPEFLERRESYCVCPFCHTEFPPSQRSDRPSLGEGKVEDDPESSAIRC